MTSGDDVDQPGFGFNPTEEHLINYYLPHKINGNHSVDCLIADIDNICKYEPEELPGLAAIRSSKHEYYFFSHRNDEPCKRRTKRGFWQVTGKKRTIKDRKNQDIIKRYLVFYTGRSSDRVWTTWAMHEYYLKPPSSTRGYVIYYLRQKSPKTIVRSVVDQDEPGHDSSSVIENPVVDQGEPGHRSSFVIKNPVVDILSPEEPRKEISQGLSFVDLQGTIGVIDESADPSFQFGSSDQHDNIQDENPVVDQGEPGHRSSFVIENPVTDILSPEKDLQFWEEILNSIEQDFTSPTEQEPRKQISQGLSFVDLQGTIGVIDESADTLLQFGSSDQHDNIQDEHYHGSLNTVLDGSIPSSVSPLIGYMNYTEAVKATVGHGLLEMHMAQALSCEIYPQINGISDECNLPLPHSGTIGRQDNISELQKSCPVIHDACCYQGSTRTGTAPVDSSPLEALGSHHRENISDIEVFNDALFCIEAAPGDDNLLLHIPPIHEYGEE